MVDQNSPISIISGHIKLEPKVRFHKFLTQDSCSDKKNQRKEEKMYSLICCLETILSELPLPPLMLAPDSEFRILTIIKWRIEG